MVIASKPQLADRTEPLSAAPSHSVVLSSPGLQAFTQNDPRVVAALDGYLESLRAGRPMPKDEFLAQHADIADQLDKCLSALEFVQGAAAQLAPDAFGSTESSDSIPRRAQLGDYQIIREVGRGGMGVVYEAEQVSLGRRVALKVLPFAAAIDPKQRQRFQIEAQAAAQLHHPHIVPIFNVGCHEGIRYYVMQFVDGRSLAAVLEELRHENGASGGGAQPSVTDSLQKTEVAPPSAVTPQAIVANTSDPTTAAPGPASNVATTAGRGSSQVLNDAAASAQAVATPTPTGRTHRDKAYCRNIARLGAEAADALDHAHGLGILHRDIKPANLLIDPQGTLWITDFGLARFPGDASLTCTGEMVGTLRYMSPEQALARRGVVDQRTDIYSLGVTLYELLTLRPAFNGRDHQELLRQIALDEPVPLRRLNPSVPTDLETIVLKAMAKDPSSRYATAQELGADLQSFMDDKPILARRPGVVERTFRWGRRHLELVATAAAIVFLALVISAGVVWSQARKTERHAQAALLASNDRINFIIDTYPEMHERGTQKISESTEMMRSSKPRNSVSNIEAAQAFDYWMRFFRQITELKPDQLNPYSRQTRAVIARAYSRLAFGNWMKSFATAGPSGPDPTLLNQALADYETACLQLEKLLAETPGDASVRRYLAQASGLGNKACCLRSASRIPQADSLYRRTLEIRRELLRSSGPLSAGDLRGDPESSPMLDDLVYLVSTTHLVANSMEAKGNREGAEKLRRQLSDDVTVAAARIQDPMYKKLRIQWSTRISMGGLPLFDADKKRDVVLNQRLAVVLDSENALALNNLADSLVGQPGAPWYEPKEGLRLAKKAVAIEPNEWSYLHTLGVAAFRARDWDEAAKTLQQAATFTGSGSYITFFLAMTYWHQGQPKEAREMYDRAVAWMDQHKPKDPELQRYREEARTLLDYSVQKPAATARATAPATQSEVPEAVFSDGDDPSNS